MGKFCMNCGTELPEEAMFCPKCGTEVEVPTCPSCGREVDFSADFCLYCGTRLREPEPEPEPVLKPQPAEPEPEPSRKVKIPEYCPRCGKKTLPGYEHSTYCGADWDVEEPDTGKEPGPSTAEDAARPEPAPQDPASAAPDGWSVWCYKEGQGADTKTHFIGVRMEERTLYIKDEIQSETQKTKCPPVREIGLAEIKNVELCDGYLIITEWSGKMTRLKGDEDPNFMCGVATAILNRIGKDPDELRVEEKAGDDTREFTWSCKRAQGRYGSAVTTVRLLLERETLRIQKEFSDTITKHVNAQPEETIPLSFIEKAEMKTKGPSFSVILGFLCIALILYGGITGAFDLGTTAVLLILVVAYMAFRYRNQIQRHQLIIAKRNGGQTVLAGDDPETMQAAAAAILERAGAAAETAKKNGKAG